MDYMRVWFRQVVISRQQINQYVQLAPASKRLHGGQGCIHVPVPTT